MIIYRFVGFSLFVGFREFNGFRELGYRIFLGYVNYKVMRFFGEICGILLGLW